MSYAFPSFAGMPGESLGVYGHDFCDADGNPAGGYAHDQPEGPYEPPLLSIYWQNGPLDRKNGKRNGAFVEDVLEIARRRLKFYQESRFNCAENAEAIEHIELALAAMTRRTADRQHRGVEGQNKV